MPDNKLQFVLIGGGQQPFAVSILRGSSPFYRQSINAGKVTAFRDFESPDNREAAGVVG
jgi:hypothetical protein